MRCKLQEVLLSFDFKAKDKVVALSRALDRNGLGRKEMMANLIQMISKIIFGLEKGSADGNTCILLDDCTSRQIKRCRAFIEGDLVFSLHISRNLKRLKTKGLFDFFSQRSKPSDTTLHQMFQVGVQITRCIQRGFDILSRW